MRTPLGDPSRDYPFMATNMDFAAQDYVEEEFFLEGRACTFAGLHPPLGSVPPMATAEVDATGIPYKTRIVVRRPASAARFNGTVLVEWVNVTAGWDQEINWNTCGEHMVRAGYAWVGMSAQHIGLHTAGTGLCNWSPARYGSLSIPRDEICYDVFSQALQALKHPLDVNPLGNLRAERVFAIGSSQSAGLLGFYHNLVHPRVGLADGFYLSVGGGPLRTDLGVKVFKILTETDVSLLGEAGFRAPDSDCFRSWEVAGTSHVGVQPQRVIEALVRDGIPLHAARCERRPFSRVPFQYAQAAAYDHLARWVSDGIAPPTAAPIELESTSPVRLKRDRFGNALGGLRLTQHAVPTATNTGENSGPPYPESFCSLFGSHQPFDETTLAELYPTKSAYLAAVDTVTDANLAAGYIVEMDAVATKQEAARWAARHWPS